MEISRFEEAKLVNRLGIRGEKKRGFRMTDDTLGPLRKPWAPFVREVLAYCEAYCGIANLASPTVIVHHSFAGLWRRKAVQPCGRIGCAYEGQ